MARYELVDGLMVEVRRVFTVGNSRAITLPAWMLMNIGVFGEDDVLALISEAKDQKGFLVRFISEKDLDDKLNGRNGDAK